MISIGMIVLMGSSYTRGAWGKHMDQPDAMLHTMLSRSLGSEVINMSMPGHGSEQFVGAYIQACKRWKPTLFLAELVEDRSLRLLNIPNQITHGISGLSAQEMHLRTFQYGEPGKPYVVNDMDGYQIHNGAGDDPSEHAILAGSTVTGFKLKELLLYFNNVRLFHEEDSLRLMRSIRNFVSLEDLSSMFGVPVLYYRHTHWTDIEDKMSGMFGDRYLNHWHGLGTGVADWANVKMDGGHLADHTHLNMQADQMVVDQLMVPFIKHHLGKQQGR